MGGFNSVEISGTVVGIFQNKKFLLQTEMTMDDIYCAACVSEEDWEQNIRLQNDINVGGYISDITIGGVTRVGLVVTRFIPDEAL